MDQRSIETDYPEAVEDLQRALKIQLLKRGSTECTYTGEQLVSTATETARVHGRQRQIEPLRYSVEAGTDDVLRWTIPESSMRSFLGVLEYQLAAGDLSPNSPQMAVYQSEPVTFKVWQGLRPPPDWSTAADSALQICSDFREQPSSTHSLQSGSSSYTVVMTFTQPSFVSSPSFRAHWTFHTGGCPEEAVMISPPSNFKAGFWDLPFYSGSGNLERWKGWLPEEGPIRSGCRESLGGDVPADTVSLMGNRLIGFRNKAWKAWSAGATSATADFPYVDSTGTGRTAKCMISVRPIERPPEEGLYLSNSSTTAQATNGGQAGINT